MSIVTQTTAQKAEFLAAGQASGLATASALAVERARIDGIPNGTVLQLQVPTVSALRAVTDRVDGRQAYVWESGKAGIFTWNSGDVSALVAVDVGMGIYVTPTGQNGTAGAWVRVIETNEYQASWFITALNQANMGLVLQSIERLRPAGSTVVLPAGNIVLSSWISTASAGRAFGVILMKRGTWRGQGDETVIDPVPNGSGNTLYNLFYVGVSGVTIRDMRFRNFKNPDNAGPPNPIMIRTPLDADVQTGLVAAGDVYDAQVINVSFDDCDTGVREMYAFANVNGVNTWFQAYHTKIIDCTFRRQTYTAIVADGNGAEIIRPKIEMTPVAPFRALSYAIRVVGATNTLIVDPDITTPIDFSAIGVMGAGVLGNNNEGGFRYGRDITIINPKVVNGKMFIGDIAGRVLIKNPRFRRDPTLTDNPVWMQIGSSEFPHNFTSLEIEGGFCVGYNNIIQLSAQNLHSIKMDGCTFIGNARTGAQTTARFYSGLTQGNDQSGAAKVPPTLLSFTNNKWSVDPSQIGIDIALTGPHTNTTIILRGNTFTEYKTGSTSYAMIVGTDPDINADGKGFVKLSTLTGITKVLGDNCRFPEGFHARMIADINRAEFITAPYPAVWA